MFNLSTILNRVLALGAALYRYAPALAGPVASAAVQFLLSLQMLHALPPDMFGGFSFLMVTSQFSTGIWAALFCAPLPVLLSQATEAGQADVRRCFFAANLASALLGLAVFLAITRSIGLPVADGLAFSGFAAATLLRWFARTYAYVHLAVKRTLISDMTYSGGVFLGLVVMHLRPTQSLLLPSVILLVATLASLLPFGRDYLVAQFTRLSLADLRRYLAVWRSHSMWAVVGVLTTEATANAHAYILTFLSGPGSFAPVAASALIIRPVGVVMNALSEFERPQIARKLASGNSQDVAKTIRFFRYILMAAWVGTACLGLVLFKFAPQKLFPPQYGLATLILGSILWMLVAGMRQFRTPESVLLQAAGAFRPLANASLLSSVISIVAVLALFRLFGPIWSIAGILAGEMVFAISVWVQSGRYRQGVMPSHAGAPAVEGPDVKRKSPS